MPALPPPTSRLTSIFFPTDIMADKEEIKAVDDAEDEVDLNYKAPEKKSLQEIQELDKDDESLVKYKQALLGNLPAQVGALSL